MSGVGLGLKRCRPAPPWSPQALDNSQKNGKHYLVKGNSGATNKPPNTVAVGVRMRAYDPSRDAFGNSLMGTYSKLRPSQLSFNIRHKILAYPQSDLVKPSES